MSTFGPIPHLTSPPLAVALPVYVGREQQHKLITIITFSRVFPLHYREMRIQKFLSLCAIGIFFLCLHNYSCILRHNSSVEKFLGIKNICEVRSKRNVDPVTVDRLRTPVIELFRSNQWIRSGSILLFRS